VPALPGPYARIGFAYCKRMSAYPQRATLGRNALPQKVDRRPNWRVRGDFRITWRFDRRVDHELSSEPRGQRASAPLPYLRDVSRHAEAFE
jgi:hypothetical protein